jgi:hypothetical protein
MAAPIVGSVAAVVVVAVLFVLWGRRRRQATPGSGGLASRLLERSRSLHGGSGTYGHSWRVRHKLADEESDRQSSRSGPQPEMTGHSAGRSPGKGSPLDGVPAFLRQ